MKTNRLWAIFALLASFSAQAFDMTDTAGKRHQLAGYKGQWVVVNFWATWCTPCIAEIPEIAQFSRDRSADGVVVLGIAIDIEDEAKTKQFAKKVGHDYPLVLGDDRVEKQFGKVKGLPTTVIFDPTGKRVSTQLGRVTIKSLNEATTPRGAAKTQATDITQRALSALKTRSGYSGLPSEPL